MRYLLLILILASPAFAYGGPVSGFDDIDFWTGEGQYRAAMAVDWVEGSSDDESLVWGFRWDGEASGFDMFRSIVAADPRFFAKVQDYGGSLGYAIYGIGYDHGDLNFALDDGTTFDANGLSEVSGSADGASPVDVEDVYEEGWFLGFWHYGVADSNPYDSGDWTSSGLGASSRMLTDGAWDSWAFTPSFDFNAFAQNPYAAVGAINPVLGDTNGDGKVDLDDLNNVRNHFGGSGLGDTDLDSDIDLDDLNNVRNNFGTDDGATAVPEPASWSLLAITGLASGATFVRRRVTTAFVAVAVMLMATVAFGQFFAAEVVSFTPGDAVDVWDPAPYQTDGTQALGSPSRDTLFGSQVGVFYPAFGSNELVIIGAGGELTVRFDSPIENDPANPFGMDLLVFGNTFYVANQDGIATGAFAEPGTISVSQDGATWFDIPDVFADDVFPTLGYEDTVYGGFGNAGGAIPTDFTLPVDPSFDAIGLTEAEINAAYAGSGGGTGVDLDLVGLHWIQYVRVSQPADATWSTEVDAFADVAPVPEPSTFVLVAIALLAIAGSHVRYCQSYSGPAFRGYYTQGGKAPRAAPTSDAGRINTSTHTLAIAPSDRDYGCRSASSSDPNALRSPEDQSRRSHVPGPW